MKKRNYGKSKFWRFSKSIFSKSTSINGKIPTLRPRCVFLFSGFVVKTWKKFVGIFVFAGFLRVLFSRFFRFFDFLNQPEEVLRGTLLLQFFAFYNFYFINFFDLLAKKSSFWAIFDFLIFPIFALFEKVQLFRGYLRPKSGREKIFFLRISSYYIPK